MDKNKMSNYTVKSGLKFKIMGIVTLSVIVSLVALGMFTVLKASTILENNLKKSSAEVNQVVTTSTVTFFQNFEYLTNFLAADANVTGHTTSAENVPWMLKLFESIQKNEPDIMNIYIGDADGKMYLIPKQTLPDGYDPRTRPWYKDAVAKDALIWTDPYADASTGKMIISCAIPVKGSSGNLVGVLAMDLELTKLSNMLNSIKIGKAGYPVLIDKSGNVMTHKDTALVGKQLPYPELLTAVKNKDAFATWKSKDADGKTYEKFGVLSRIDKMGWTVISVMYKNEIDADSNSLIMIIFIGGIAALALSFGFIYLFMNTVTRRIQHLVGTMNKVRTGDLTAKVDSSVEDEIGLLANYFQDTINDLGKLVNNIHSVSSELTLAAQNLAATSEEASASADEVARTVEDIAKGAQEQASDAERGAVIVKDLSTKFVQLSDNTNRMLDAAKSLNQANTTGLDAINSLKTKTQLTNVANNKIQDVINELNEKTKHIGTILDSISAISVQTNLLALNASIEAARAGEHGRGFAVVAEEIRKLAEESAKAADEVRTIVTNIQGDSVKTVDSMSELKVIADEQNHAVNDVFSSFDTISTSYDEISGQIRLIGDSVGKLTSDKDVIVSSIENISAVSQETAAASEEVNASMDQQATAVEEVAKSAEKLNEISVSLNTEISKFKV